MDCVGRGNPELRIQLAHEGFCDFREVLLDLAEDIRQKTVLKSPYAEKPQARSLFLEADRKQSDQSLLKVRSNDKYGFDAMEMP
jgi:hypothetical protein